MPLKRKGLLGCERERENFRSKPKPKQTTWEKTLLLYKITGCERDNKANLSVLAVIVSASPGIHTSLNSELSC